MVVAKLELGLLIGIEKLRPRMNELTVVGCDGRIYFPFTLDCFIWD
jgi:hypothetical protein